MTQELLLASASPRRRQLIHRLGLPVTTTVSPIDEDALQRTFDGPAAELAQWTSYHKAQAALTLPEAAGRVVVTADTTVVLDDTVLGKPADEAEAYHLLSTLRGRWHRVVTGVTVAQQGDQEPIIYSERCITPVLMRSYSDEEIYAYIATGDPLDKAGAYGIQHPSFQPTERINGCYLNVVGLPLCTLVSLLAHFSVQPATMLHDTTDSYCPWSERCQRP